MWFTRKSYLNLINSTYTPVTLLIIFKGNFKDTRFTGKIYLILINPAYTSVTLSMILKTILKIYGLQAKVT